MFKLVGISVITLWAVVTVLAVLAWIDTRRTRAMVAQMDAFMQKEFEEFVSMGDDADRGSAG
jgi:hypothetical protein